MKLRFSYLILFFLFTSSAPNAFASREIILVENTASVADGKMLLDIMQKKFNVPLELVTMKTTSNCSKKSEAILHLCLNSGGELEILKVDRFVMKNSFGTFFEL